MDKRIPGIKKYDQSKTLLDSLFTLFTHSSGHILIDMADVKEDGYQNLADLGMVVKRLFDVPYCVIQCTPKTTSQDLVNAVATVKDEKGDTPSLIPRERGHRPAIHSAAKAPRSRDQLQAPGPHTLPALHGRDAVGGGNGHPNYSFGTAGSEKEHKRSTNPASFDLGHPVPTSLSSDSKGKRLAFPRPTPGPAVHTTSNASLESRHNHTTDSSSHTLRHYNHHPHDEGDGGDADEEDYKHGVKSLQRAGTDVKKNHHGSKGIPLLDIPRTYRPSGTPNQLNGTRISLQTTSGRTSFATLWLLEDAHLLPLETQTYLLQALTRRVIHIGSKACQLPEFHRVIATRNSNVPMKLMPPVRDMFLLELRGSIVFTELHLFFISNDLGRAKRASALVEWQHIEDLKTYDKRAHIELDLSGYLRDIVAALRHDSRVRIGPSLRARKDFEDVLKIRAILSAADFVTPLDFPDAAVDVLSHRITSSREFDGQSIREIVSRYTNKILLPPK